jgi:(2Fe-2S) ferredoxin
MRTIWVFYPQQRSHAWANDTTAIRRSITRRICSSAATAAPTAIRASCAAAGSEKLRDYMKVRAKELGLSKVRVNMAGCLDRCEQGPCLVIYPEGIWYKIATTADVDAVLDSHVVRGERLPALMLPRETR